LAPVPVALAGELPLLVAVDVAVAVGGGGTASADGVEALPLPDMVGGSEVAVLGVDDAALVGGGVPESGETAWTFMFCPEAPVVPRSLPTSEAEFISCCGPKSPGGFKSGVPVCAAMETSGAVFVTSRARCTRLG